MPAGRVATPPHTAPDSGRLLLGCSSSLPYQDGLVPASAPEWSLPAGRLVGLPYAAPVRCRCTLHCSSYSPRRGGSVPTLVLESRVPAVSGPAPPHSGRVGRDTPLRDEISVQLPLRQAATS